jgi:hypothetical protein
LRALVLELDVSESYMRLMPLNTFNRALQRPISVERQDQSLAVDEDDARTRKTVDERHAEIARLEKAAGRAVNRARYRTGRRRPSAGARSGSSAPAHLTVGLITPSSRHG